MENNQSTQHHSSQLDNSQEPLKRPKSVGTNNLNSLLTLIKRSPWLIWGGVWILLLTTSVISIFSLTHPLGVKEEPSKPITVAKPTGVEQEPSKPVTVAKPTENSSQAGRPRPILWLVGAAAFTVAIGSLVILKQLNTSVEAPRLRAAKRGLTRRQQRKLLLQEISPQIHSEPLLPLPLADEKPGEMPLAATQLLDSGVQEVVPNVPLSTDGSGSNSLHSQPKVPRFEQKISSAPSGLTPENNLNCGEPVVTVLLPEESDLVDPAEESLAEAMDIRKHRSLSSILHDS